MAISTSGVTVALESYSKLKKNNSNATKNVRHWLDCNKKQYT